MLEKIKVSKDEPDIDYNKDELMDDNDLEYRDYQSDDDSFVSPKVELNQIEMVNNNKSNEGSDYDPNLKS